jgi:hypothetical protein
MFDFNPFLSLSDVVSTTVARGYVVVMFLLVFLGTLYDIVHKGSAKFFFDHWRKSRDKASKKVSTGEFIGIISQTALIDVLTSAEFCNARRRIAHLLTMYGFIFYVVATAVLVFSLPASPSPATGLWTAIWWLGALMICVGGYWFWFFIRVDVAVEGNSPFRIISADLFVLSLMGSATFALLWGYAQLHWPTLQYIFFGLYVISSTVLFGSVPWSKFAHMFFKPAAAVEKRLSVANGTRNNLPPPADAPEKFGSARTAPRHY